VPDCQKLLHKLASERGILENTHLRTDSMEGGAALVIRATGTWVVVRIRPFKLEETQKNETVGEEKRGLRGSLKDNGRRIKVL